MHQKWCCVGVLGGEFLLSETQRTPIRAITTSATMVLGYWMPTIHARTYVAWRFTRACRSSSSGPLPVGQVQHHTHAHRGGVKISKAQVKSSQVAVRSIQMENSDTDLADSAAPRRTRFTLGSTHGRSQCPSCVVLINLERPSSVMMWAIPVLA